MSPAVATFTFPRTDARVESKIGFNELVRRPPELRLETVG